MIAGLTVLLGVILAQLSPGPNMMAVATAAFGTGRRAGIVTALGIASGVFIWCILFSLGIGALLQTYPETLVAMRLVGGAYLLFLGFKSLKSIFSKPKKDETYQNLKLSGFAAYRRGLLVVMTNPKAALMWVAISMFLASSGVGAVEFLAIGIMASCSAAMIYGGYAVLFSTGVAVRGYHRFFRSIDAAFGLLFGAFGAKLISEGVRDIHAAS